MYSTFKGKIKVKDLTNDFMRKIQYDASYPTYKVSNSTIINKDISKCKLTLSLVHIEDQMDFYSNEIDVLKSVVDEINHAYLSPISHLTPHLISEDKLSETIKEQNKILET